MVKFERQEPNFFEQFAALEICFVQRGNCLLMELRIFLEMTKQPLVLDI
jgi:hypothetical protein